LVPLRREEIIFGCFMERILIQSRNQGNQCRDLLIVRKLCRECTKPTRCYNLEGFVAEIIYLLFVNSSFHSCLTKSCQQITNIPTKVVDTDTLLDVYLFMFHPCQFLYSGHTNYSQDPMRDHATRRPTLEQLTWALWMLSPHPF
jgi:hypothetical protein